MRFKPTLLTKAEEDLREEVKSFLRAELPRDSYVPGLGMNAEASPEFSKKLAAKGWIGMAIPKEYGGHGRSAVERFVVVEELLRAGAPVGAHWVADRQTAPSLMAYGTEQQKRKFLPSIARGECYFSIGLSEPDSGSDLASVRTMATKSDGGWLLNGTKIWTSGAHRNHYFAVLCRTSQLGEDRHQGLSQLLVDLSSAGLTINPIRLLNGSHHFNEVVFDDVFVPEDMVLGEVDMGWKQATSELAYERSGPDRYLSSYQLLEQYLAEYPQQATTPATQAALGHLVSRLWMIRQLSLSVAKAIDEHKSPAVEAAIVKDMGTTFEQEVVQVIQSLLEEDPDPGANSLFERLLAESIMISPTYTLRGGTTEVLRTVAARSLRSTK
ncbi:MAG: acyl-CoA dehydrogenase family protein [Ferrimicrobium sp.]